MTNKQELPRERFKSNGIKALSNQELIALLIGSGTKSLSVFELAKQLMETLPEGMADLEHLSFEDLMAYNGIGEGKACQIIAGIEIGRRVYHGRTTQKNKVLGPSDIGQLLMSELRYKRQEHFVVVLLDTKNQVIAVETVSMGTLNATLVHPREVFTRAIKRSAHGVILVHNHPSGIPEPSKEDLDLTARLVEAGKIIGIHVLDHVIIGDGVWHSLKEHGQV